MGGRSCTTHRYHARSYHALSNRALSYRALSYRALSCHALSYRALVTMESGFFNGSYKSENFLFFLTSVCQCQQLNYLPAWPAVCFLPGAALRKIDFGPKGVQFQFLSAEQVDKLSR